MKKHVLVATDGSDTAMRAVDLAAEIAGKFDVPLTIGHVLQFGRPSKELRRMADIEHITDSVKRSIPTWISIFSQRLRRCAVICSPPRARPPTRCA